VTKLPTIEELFKAGAHFGHPRQKAHPKARAFVYGVQRGVNIIDLTESLEYIKRALEYIKNQKKEGKNFLIVGTKRQIAEAVKEFAREIGMPYVTHKWLGGVLTNFSTIRKNIKKLEELEELKKSDKYKEYTKKERSLLEKKLGKLQRDFEGLRDMARLPDNLLVIDAWEERIAVAEARKLKIPIVAITDTNWNPQELDYAIPVNDDVLSSVKLILDLIKETMGGKKSKEKDASKDKKN
jgi:small subunit ribosomal protein S2